MSEKFIQAIDDHAKPFRGSHDLTPLLEEIGDAKIVLLGEASHGTAEFYSIRAELSKRLVEEKGFQVVAVEGDWPSCQQVNRYIKGFGNHKSARDTLQAFKRWPTWMWANEEMVDFTEWLKAYNESKGKEEKIGFYGIDVYSLWESMEEILNYLKENEPNGANLKLARKAFSCFEPHHQQAEKYAIAASFFKESCVDEVTELLTSIRTSQDLYKDDEESDLNLKINALVANNAERYYRSMVKSDSESWNIRDMHMVETINEIRNYYGPDTKIVVWEHNTHVGDASATDMNGEGMINVGQLVREQNYEEDVFIVGFGTYQGTVIAADEWGSNYERIIVPRAQRQSWEHAMHEAGAYNKLLIFNEGNRHLFTEPVGHRAIGVVYNPEFESYGNYVPSVMSERYDAYIHVDETNALQPIALSGVYL
ncbi:erythromycin esterase family protein [Aquibacillus salsiterrae]|uniref:Erythromycin esterase family protein n=1 Tax=Aquibacillus salsiterrae TaxID=2950439 RepID=A0A9X3WGD2_9BACI|nr:erythromycin esterase family protein [Aquibacillus salsiterrae]MDC3418513.1 erythromycin esterase family protein [Aquibacillus salsiterrae]